MSDARSPRAPSAPSSVRNHRAVGRYLRDRSGAAIARGTAALCLLGVPGAAVLAVVGARSSTPPRAAGVAALVGAAFLFAAAVGVLLAPRIGLWSHVLARVTDGEPVLPALRPELLPAVGAGVALATVGAAADLALGSFSAVPLAGASLGIGAPGTDVARAAAVYLLYFAVGGELLLRWGVMTGALWIGWGIEGGGGASPPPRAAWGAVLLSAGLFGLVHLPIVAIGAVPAITLRIAVIDGLGGVVYGWLYWWSSLEAAIVAHATAYAALVVLVTVAALA